MFQPKGEAVSPMPMDLARERMGGARGAATSGLYGTVARKCEHATTEPLGESPSFKDEGIPGPSKSFEGHGLVSKERGR